ncbi:MAG: hypothetical protein V4604_18110 [Bacteroidota bacterium]
MRFLLYLSFILLLTACSKNKRIIKHIEGRWKLTQILLNDGLYSYPNEIHEFAQGESGGKTFATWTKYSSDFSDTIVGSYKIDKKGQHITFRDDEASPVTEEFATIDDFDKTMLIVRRVDGVYFFYKE